MKSLVIVNPAAGGLPEASELRSVLEPLGQVEILESGSPEEARALAERAGESGVGQIVAAGGDGTVNQVVHGILASGAEVRLGILPVGTANDYARSLGLPLDLEEAVRAIAETGTPRPVDVVEIAGEERRFFANLAVGGFGGRNDTSADSEAKSRWGKLAYMLEAAEELPEIQTYRVRAELDDGTEEGEVISLILANGTTSGGGIRVAPAARIDDGLLDVIMIPALGLPELATLVPRVLTGKHLGDDRVALRRSRRVLVEAEPPIPFRADGEELGLTPLEFRVVPRALVVATGGRPRRRNPGFRP